MDGTSWKKAEQFVETGWTAIAQLVASEQFRGPLASNEFHDLSHDLLSVAEALVAVVDEQFPQEPGPIIPGG